MTKQEQIKKLQEEVAQETQKENEEKLLNKWIVSKEDNYTSYSYVIGVNKDCFEVSSIEKYDDGRINDDCYNFEVYYEEEWYKYKVISEEEVKKELMNGLDKWVDSIMEECK